MPNMRNIINLLDYVHTDKPVIKETSGNPFSNFKDWGKTIVESTMTMEHPSVEIPDSYFDIPETESNMQIAWLINAGDKEGVSPYPWNLRISSIGSKNNNSREIAELVAKGEIHGNINGVNWHLIAHTQMDEEFDEEPSVQMFTGPAYWASYLVNGDASGLEPEEKIQADKWKESILPYHVQGVEHDEGQPIDPRFSHHFALHSGTDFEGGDVVDYVCGKHEHALDEEYEEYEEYDDDDDGEENEEWWEDEDDGLDFADSSGRSALRASSASNPRIHPCPTCGRENMLTGKDVNLGYQCDGCADGDEF